MKKSLKYILLIFLIIVLAICVTISIQYIKYGIKGELNYNNSYYEIKYSNVSMDNEEITVKIDEKNNSIHIEVPQLDRENNITLDLTNIGSKDIVVDNYMITNIDTLLDQDNVVVSISLVEGEIIKGGSSKKIIVNIKNNNKTKGYYNFNVDYIFKES